jgi:DNA polymerase-3 subunit gamma/tau
VPTAPSAAAAKAQPKAAGPVGDGAKPISAAVPAGTASPGFDGDWPALAARLPVVALARELATRSELVSFADNHLRLRVPARALAEASTVERLKAALERHFGQPVRVSVEVGAVQGGTAAQRAQDDADAQRARAADALAADPTVQQLISTFGATLDPQSIQAHGK